MNLKNFDYLNTFVTFPHSKLILTLEVKRRKKLRPYFFRKHLLVGILPHAAGGGSEVCFIIISICNINLN